ncbi:acyl-CoA thioesterase [Blastomonas aquatica]|uniref:Thioesterase n=1 Tax=Blastomonas aquatica TaxID=1510276 RepID=A0ABQ1JM13_9SPHN|nr:thioesterase family protein [Blastomonas aquatica]GGB72483.1 thioesterase [Blastomonas aquatica]
MSRPQRPLRADYRAFTTITTRWSDNDIYGHVNNSVYYFWFDTAVNEYLIKAGALDIHAGETIGLVVETGCAYFAPTAFPDTIHAGIRVDHIGTSSVRYGVGLFRNDDDEAAAAGHFTHVYVGRDSRRPVALPEALRTALEAIRS